MFINVARFVLFFGFLALVYIALSAYERYAVRQRLKDEFASGRAGGLNREDYIRQGLARYERSWGKKLLYGIFIIPLIVILSMAVIGSYL